MVDEYAHHETYGVPPRSYDSAKLGRSSFHRIQMKWLRIEPSRELDDLRLTYRGGPEVIYVTGL